MSYTREDIHDTERTIREYLEMLCEPYRSQAFYNAIEYSHDGEGTNRLDVTVSCMHAAIDKAFHWSPTEQGHDYWQSIHDPFEYDFEEEYDDTFGDVLDYLSPLTGHLELTDNLRVDTLEL